ncbi:MAG: tyrosine-type recombinase/integrase [Phormidesmis sp.]
MTRQRGRRGGVSVTARGGILRLRWSYKGKRQHLSLQIPDTARNRSVAAEKARQIEADLVSGDYDDTLTRYRLAHTVELPAPHLSTVELFELFTDFKRLDGVSGQAINTKYSALRSNIARLGRDILSLNDARQLVQLLRDRQSPLIANQNLFLLKSFGKWLVNENYFATNFFESIRSQKGSAAKKQDRTPFSRQELALFLQTMREHPTAAHYYDFTVVLFSLGLRPSEAIGLRWRDVSLSRQEITIRESLSRSPSGKSSGAARQRKGTKTGNVRVLPLNDRLIHLFTGRWHLEIEPDELIFTGVEGLPIDDHNYRERYWKVVCKDAGIPYRPPYTARHTLLSYGIEYGGWSLKQAAYMAGHKDIKMIAETYGHLMDKPELPDLGDIAP